MNQKYNFTIKKLTFLEYNNILFTEELPYLQSWDYGDIKFNVENIKVYRYIICNHNHKKIAYFQMLTKGLKNLIFYAKINRGPIIFDNVYSEIEIIDVIKNFLIKKCVFIFDITPNSKYLDDNKLFNIGFYKKKNI